MQSVLKLLYAEDDVGLRRLNSSSLQAHGYEVVETKDPWSTIDALSRETFDLILLDLVMPRGYEQGGAEVLVFLRERTIDTPVIIVSAYGKNGLAVAAREANPSAVREVLVKGCSQVDIIAAIRRHTHTGAGHGVRAT